MGSSYFSNSKTSIADRYSRFIETMDSLYTRILTLLSTWSLALLPLLGLLVASCGSSEEATPDRRLLNDTLAPRTPVPNYQQNPNLIRDEEMDNKIKLTFDNGNSEVTVPLDPDKQNFMLELSGDFKKQKEKLTRSDSALKKQKQQWKQKRDSIIKARTNERINEVMKNFRQAQNLFYRNDYESAMKYIDRALDIAETAEAKGLKGTIFFMQDNMKAARYWWNQAVQQDPDIRIPDIPDLRELIDTNNIKQDTTAS